AVRRVLPSPPTRRSSDLLPSPGRLGANTRYGREHLDRLHLIRTLQDQGLSLAEIRDRLEPRPAPMLADASWAPLEPRLAMHRSRSEEHTSELQSRENLVC